MACALKWMTVKSIRLEINEWERKGASVWKLVPVICSRTGCAGAGDTGDKEVVALTDLTVRVPALLAEIQNNMLEKAKKFRADNTHRTDDYEEFKQIIEEKRGFVISGWCGHADCEAAVKEETKATIRNIPSFRKNTRPLPVLRQ